MIKVTWISSIRCHSKLPAATKNPQAVYPPATQLPTDHMVSWRQEQNPIMNSAVPFLKMLTLYMLLRAQFLADLGLAEHTESKLRIGFFCFT